MEPGVEKRAVRSRKWEAQCLVRSILIVLRAVCKAKESPLPSRVNVPLIICVSCSLQERIYVSVCLYGICTRFRSMCVCVCFGRGKDTRCTDAASLAAVSGTNFLFFLQIVCLFLFICKISCAHPGN